MPDLDLRQTTRRLRFVAIAIMATALLPLPGLVHDLAVRSQIDETQAAADRFQELRSRLALRATGSSALDLAEDVALRRGLGDILGVLQAHHDLQPGLDQIQLRLRIDGWFEGREDARLAEDLEGALSTSVRAARARARWSRQLLTGLLLLAVISAGATLLVVLQERRRLHLVIEQQEPAAGESSAAATVVAVSGNSGPVSEPGSLPSLPEVPAAVSAVARPASSSTHRASAYPPPPSTGPSWPMPTTPATPPLRIGALRGRVLVVEDNPINQRVTQRQLSELALQVEVVPDGERALIRMQAESWDAVLMDLQLPGIDGLTATRRWREHEAAAQAAQRLPIVAITANALGTDREACFAAGMDGYLAKPARLEDLQRVLSRYLNAVGSEVQIPAPMPSMLIADLPLPELTDPMLWAKLRSETARSDPRMLEELLVDLRQKTPEMLEELQAALVASDWERLRATSHRLKGSAGMLGLPRLATGAKALESAAKMREPALAVGALAELRTVAAATFADPAVSGLLGELGPAGPREKRA
jgi:CheY-like chemotaxis protein/HPt (histidine-containing phosphotransfer) domain-containing protein